MSFSLLLNIVQIHSAYIFGDYDINLLQINEDIDAIPSSGFHPSDTKPTRYSNDSTTFIEKILKITSNILIYL